MQSLEHLYCPGGCRTCLLDISLSDQRILDRPVAEPAIVGIQRKEVSLHHQWNPFKPATNKLQDLREPTSLGRHGNLQEIECAQEGMLSSFRASV